MRDLIYGQSGLVIAGVLLATLFVLIQWGWRLGCKGAASRDEKYRAHINTLLGSVLGLMGLMLGFTFSMALNRYDGRSDALVAEANAIGTAYLRAQLLPEAVRAPARDLIARHVELRLAEGEIGLDEEFRRAGILVESGALLEETWDLATRAAAIDPNPVTTGLFVQALNDMIDQFGQRNMVIERHVPELVLVLLFGAVLLTGLVLGYSCGVAGHRPSIISFAFGLLVVFVTYIIIDIDRPRRGLIQVDRAILDSLAADIRADRAGRTTPAKPGPGT